MQIGLEDIRHGLRTFDATFFQAPGRMNIFNEHPFKVILDYAHNAAAVRAMCNLVDRFEPKGRRIVVLSAPGDRRDEDIRDIAAEAAGHFDHFICRADDNPRGRGPDEVPRMLRDRLLEAGHAPDTIDVIADEQAATLAALRMAKPDDLILILSDAIKRTWKQIIYFDAQSESDLPAKKQPIPLDELQSDTFRFDDSLEIISDERGVRIAREAGD
jgi:cyanophycin synthetase